MGTLKNQRPKGTGGLQMIKRTQWNEAKQKFEEVELYLRSIEVKDSPDGKRKRITGSGRTAEEAERRLQRSIERRGGKKALIEAGVIDNKPKGGLSTEEYLLRWHSEISEKQVSVTMRIKYLQHLHNHVIPHIGDVPLAALSHKDLRVLFESVLPSKVKLKNGLPTDEPLLGPSGLLNVYKTLNRALNVAVAEGLLPRNPMGLIKPPRFERPNENIPQFMHIIHGMFQKMKRENDPLHDYFYLALLGLRRGERLGLSWSNVNLNGDNPNIVIKQQIQRISGVGVVIKPSTKSGQERRIAIDGEFVEVLRRLKAQRKIQLKDPKFHPSKTFEDLVFLSKTGKPVDPNTDNEIWRATLDRNRVPVHIRQHAMRHVAATFLSDLNVPEAVAKSLLGHQSSAMQTYYGRETSRKNRDAVKAYAEVLSSKR
jgi:integrase